MNGNKPLDGVSLMADLFLHICKTAPKRMFVREGGDFIVALETGQNEGQAVRLCRIEEAIWIEFHPFFAAATEPDHSNISWYKLHMQLKPTQVIDPIVGKLYNTQFTLPETDISLLMPRRRNLMPYMINFAELVLQLPCHHMWEDEVSASWAKAQQSILQAHDEMATK